MKLVRTNSVRVPAGVVEQLIKNHISTQDRTFDLGNKDVTIVWECDNEDTVAPNAVVMWNVTLGEEN